MKITFPGGVAVHADFDGFCIRTDQPKTGGGEGSAPAPFDLFMASLGTCAGFYALRFCQERQLPTRGLKLTLDWERDVPGHRLSKIRLALYLPPEFPEKYRRAVIRAVNQCSVKRTILDPPEFEVVAV
jgi:ribosomal protein S12 methylthiotransferase accessory factor